MNLPMIDSDSPLPQTDPSGFNELKLGHISLYSRQSLIALGSSQRFNFASFSPNAHVYWKRIPVWASHIFPSA